MNEQLKQQILATSDMNEKYTLCNESSFIYGRIKDYQECNITELRNRVKYVDTYYKDIVRKINDCLMHLLYDNFSNSVLYNTRLYCHFSTCKSEYREEFGLYYKKPLAWSCNKVYEPETRSYEPRVYMNAKWLEHFKDWLAEHLKNMMEKLQEKEQEKQKQKEEKEHEKQMKLQEKKLEKEMKLQEKKLEKEIKLQEKQKQKEKKLQEQQIYQHVKHVCCCGGTYTISNVSTHHKTKKHMMHIMNINDV